MWSAIKNMVGRNVIVSPLITIDGEKFTIYGMITEIKTLRASNKVLSKRLKQYEHYVTACEETAWKRIRVN